jgi:predicted GNAT family N-acyltransferase
MSRFEIISVAWNSPQAALLRTVREQVFIQEQRVPAALEWESHDDEMQAVHLLALDAEGEAIGTVRLSPNGRIGRMAVMANWRKQGVGSALLTKIVAIAQARACPRIFLHAQTQAVAFYKKFGFTACGTVFEDAGIPHQEMFLNSVVL